MEERQVGQSAMGICAFCYKWNLFGVMVFQKSMLDWRGGGYIWQRYMSMLIYVKLLWCSGVAYINCQLEEGVGSICNGYMCMLLYMKPMWCNGIPEIYAQLEEGWGQSAMGISAFCYKWNLFGVMVFQKSMLDWRGGGYIWQRYMSMLIYVKLLWCSGVAYINCQLEEGGGVNLPWVYVKSAIHETYLV